MRQQWAQRTGFDGGEALWRRHRSLTADALVVHGVIAEEIVSPTRLQVHKLTHIARVDGSVIICTHYETETSAGRSGARTTAVRYA